MGWYNPFVRISRDYSTKVVKKIRVKLELFFIMLIKHIICGRYVCLIVDATSMSGQKVEKESCGLSFVFSLGVFNSKKRS